MNLSATKKVFSNFEWYDLNDPSEEELREFSEEHNLDFLQIHDVLQTGHLPKHEKVKGYDFIILRPYSEDIGETENSVTSITNKISFFLGPKKLITIHRVRFPFLDKYFKINKNVALIKTFLLMVNDIIETYREPLERQAKFVAETEKALFFNTIRSMNLAQLYEVRAEVRIFRKLLAITEKVFLHFMVRPTHKGAFQDVKDRLLELSLLSGEINDDLNEIMQMYLSLQSQKSNDVMKTLTIFSAFFLPLTFIAGIYGMNFDFMPELKTKFGYFFTLGAMLVISVAIYLWFRMKKIIG